MLRQNALLPASARAQFVNFINRLAKGSMTDGCSNGVKTFGLLP